MIVNQFIKASSCLKLSHISRQFHLGIITKAAATQASPLYKLRQKTGLAYNLCREALDKHGNNLDEAEAWLKAQAMAHGLQKATKVRGRSAREGLVGLAVHENNKLATVVEINCETDFVAKNQVFKDLALDLTQQISHIQSDCTIDDIPDQEFIKLLKLNENQMKKLDDQIVPMIAKLGENIKIQRATHFKIQCDDDKMKLFGQIHAKTGHRIQNGLELTAGRFGAIVALKDLSQTNRSIRGFGNRLCQHIIGFSPTYIELPDNIRKNLEQVEREQIEKAKREEEEAKNKKEEEGDEIESDSEENKLANSMNRDDWPSIMDQQIIMSDDQSVRDYCKENSFSIIYFNRFECGQDS